VIRNGLRWRDAPEVYGPHKTSYNRFARWSRMGMFARIFSNLVADDEPPDCLMIDSTHLIGAGAVSGLRLRLNPPHAPTGSTQYFR